MNQAVRQELLALVEQDHAFVSAPEHDPNSDQVQPQLLELHTMPDPEVLRRCLRLLEDAAEAGEAEPWQVAFLVDRLSLVERNVQVYGTTICRQADGSFGPPLLEDPDRVDARRRAVGLPPLEQDIRSIERFQRQLARLGVLPVSCCCGTGRASVL
jgi:hypothetical protein